MITELLKKETRQFHDEIEQKLASNKLFEGTFSQNDYYKMLVVNHQFIQVLEPQIKALLSASDLAFLERINLNKVALLENDLIELNLEIKPIKPIQLITNRAEALGALYVIEGSMLGGMVIAKQLKKYPELEQAGFNYFGHYGQDIGPIWKSFVAYLNDNMIEEVAQQEVLKGAKIAYTYLIELADEIK